MAFDYKKEYKEFYLPKNKPQIVDIPTMNFIAVRGKGNPNEEGGAYKAAISLLYGIAFTIKMSYKGAIRLRGILTTLFHRLRVSGGKKASVGSIIPIRKSSSGFPSSVCRIL